MINSYENLPDKYKEPQIRLIDKDVDFSQLEMSKLDWDIEAGYNVWDVYRINGFNHTTGGKWGAYPYWACPAGETPTYENLIQFGADIMCKWGIHVEDSLYIKTKWGETGIRNNVLYKILRNGKVFYADVANDFDFALTEARRLLFKAQEFPIAFQLRNFEKEILNRKIWYHDEPAVITGYIEGQAAVIIEPDGIEEFKVPVWAETDEDWDEYRKSVKETMFTDHIYWFRG